MSGASVSSEDRNQHDFLTLENSRQIVRSDSDLLRVPSRDFRLLRDEELVRLLVLHRERGDVARAKEAWDQLVENIYDVMRARVAAWRWRGKDVRVPRDDIEDVTQLAIIRLGGALQGFAGDVFAVFRAYALTVADHTCMDFSRKEMRRDMGIAGNLEDTVPGDEGEVSRWEPLLAAEAERVAAREHEKLEVEEMVDRGLSRIPSADQRAVVEMTRDGVPADEIAGALDTSLDNVYQLRRRGLTKLKEVLGDGLG